MKIPITIRRLLDIKIPPTRPPQKIMFAIVIAMCLEDSFFYGTLDLEKFGSLTLKYMSPYPFEIP